MSTRVCHCGRPVEPRDPDPWEGRMDDYCEDCATCRCDTAVSTCPHATGSRAATGEECIGIISEVGFGMRDCDAPVLWFTVHTDEAWASLQVFEVDQAVEIIKDYRVRDVRDLNGKPIWMRKQGPRMNFVRAWKR